MYSDYGSIIHISDLNKGSVASVKITNCSFESISAKKYGGIVYSHSKYTPYYVFFDDCNFKNVSATFGNICYSLDKNSEPSISNMEELKKEKGNMATNPTMIQFSQGSQTSVSLLSGEKLPNGLECNIYDDYDNSRYWKTLHIYYYY